MHNDINNFVPSLLNPRTINKEKFSLTQNSTVSRCSLSLKRNIGLANRDTNRTVPAKKKLFSQDNRRQCNTQNTSLYAKSISTLVDLDLSGFEEEKENSNHVNPIFKNLATKQLSFFNNVDLADASTVHISSDDLQTQAHGDITNWDLRNEFLTSTATNKLTQEKCSLDFSVFEDLQPISDANQLKKIEIQNVVCNHSLKSGSSATELHRCEDTILHDLNEESHVSISFGIQDCEFVDLTTKNSNIKKVSISHKDNFFNLDCEIVECTPLSSESEYDENMNETTNTSQKRSGVAVNLEIKNKKLATDALATDAQNSKVLILKTDAIEKLSHVIVQPQNCKLVKRHLNNSIFGSSKNYFGIRKNGKSAKLKQKSITSFFAKDCKEAPSDTTQDVAIVENDAVEMSKITGVSDSKCSRPYRPEWKGEPSPRCRVASAPKHPESRSRGKQNSARSISPLKRLEPFTLSAKTKSTRTLGSAKAVPHYMIVAGTHFAVDAFSYGDIPSVKHYFLTHFHSDHYSGLKKNFSKLLYCSKITGDLCVSRLGVNPKCIHILNLEETTRIEGVEVTAVDANHCPGAVMLFFCLPNGMTILHTGDFRATPAMESYPVFWNSDVHTIYLDTTYCNPRYDFPTQEQSLEMALSFLRAKKTALEKSGKKFSSVLIVCGTYTIGKEKFFLGMARRVGCSVWACPEKDKVLQTVEGRSFSTSPPHLCQLHAVPMRDLSHEKLKSYLESLNGAFTEVVAFKPSGWENGKNTTVEKDMVTIHGIPYSEHSSFSELIRFVKFLKPKQVVPTVDISGGVKAVQKYFPCPLVFHDEAHNQSKVTDYFSIENRQQVPAVT
ncbi:DNA cross-link repair 1A protein [Cydia amplana]|uniref:DNA cross-link repair 1A protein n=1 Tax=Cydia amplana TaxID=1869771 RepID=UPI002FE5BA1C